MIIVRLKGGLGNQLFQYAMARRLAHANSVQMVVDAISGFRNDDFHRSYCLDHFNITARIASSDEIAGILGRNLFSRSLSAVSRRLGIFNGKCTFVRERTNLFEGDLFDLCPRGDTYLDGYWQTEKYFLDIRSILLREFSVNVEMETANKKYFGDIENTNSVSVHVRRKDLVKHPVASRIIGTIPSDYYQRAIAFMEGAVRRAHFFVFSDDPAWAMKNLSFSSPVEYVSCNLERRDYEDLRLMSCCKNNIIANSTFSWWGAWLNRNPSKIVCAPMRWFADETIDSSDLVPADWKRF